MIRQGGGPYFLRVAQFRMELVDLRTELRDVSAEEIVDAALACRPITR